MCHGPLLWWEASFFILHSEDQHDVLRMNQNIDSTIMLHRVKYTNQPPVKEKTSDLQSTCEKDIFHSPHGTGLIKSRIS